MSREILNDPALKLSLVNSGHSCHKIPVHYERSDKGTLGSGAHGSVYKAFSIYRGRLHPSLNGLHSYRSLKIRGIYRPLVPLHSSTFSLLDNIPANLQPLSPSFLSKKKGNKKKGKNKPLGSPSKRQRIENADTRGNSSSLSDTAEPYQERMVKRRTARIYLPSGEDIVYLHQYRYYCKNPRLFSGLKPPVWKPRLRGKYDDKPPKRYGNLTELQLQLDDSDLELLQKDFLIDNIANVEHKRRAVDRYAMNALGLGYTEQVQVVQNTIDHSSQMNPINPHPTTPASSSVSPQSVVLTEVYYPLRLRQLDAYSVIDEPSRCVSTTTVIQHSPSTVSEPPASAIPTPSHHAVDITTPLQIPSLYRISPYVGQHARSFSTYSSLSAYYSPYSILYPINHNSPNLLEELAIKKASGSEHVAGLTPDNLRELKLSNLLSTTFKTELCSLCINRWYGVKSPVQWEMSKNNNKNTTAQREAEPSAGTTTAAAATTAVTPPQDISSMDFLSCRCYDHTANFCFQQHLLPYNPLYFRLDHIPAQRRHGSDVGTHTNTNTNTSTNTHHTDISIKSEQGILPHTAQDSMSDTATATTTTTTTTTTTATDDVKPSTLTPSVHEPGWLSTPSQQYPVQISYLASMSEISSRLNRIEREQDRHHHINAFHRLYAHLFPFLTNTATSNHLTSSTAASPAVPIPANSSSTSSNNKSSSSPHRYIDITPIPSTTLQQLVNYYHQDDAVYHHHLSEFYAAMYSNAVALLFSRVYPMARCAPSPSPAQIIPTQNSSNTVLLQQQVDGQHPSADKTTKTTTTVAAATTPLTAPLATAEVSATAQMPQPMATKQSGNEADGATMNDHDISSSLTSHQKHTGQQQHQQQQARGSKNAVGLPSLMLATSGVHRLYTNYYKHRLYAYITHTLLQQHQQQQHHHHHSSLGVPATIQRTQTPQLINIPSPLYSSIKTALGGGSAVHSGRRRSHDITHTPTQVTTTQTVTLHNIYKTSPTPSLHHPHSIVPFSTGLMEPRDFYVHKSNTLSVYELLPYNLRDIVFEEYIGSIYHVKRLFYLIVHATHYLHLNGFLHRDLKPENILLRELTPSTLLSLPHLVQSGTIPVQSRRSGGGGSNIGDANSSTVSASMDSGADFTTLTAYTSMDYSHRANEHLVKQQYHYAKQQGDTITITQLEEKYPHLFAPAGSTTTGAAPGAPSQPAAASVKPVPDLARMVCKLADFGSCRPYGDPRVDMSPRVGTIWYRAPELLLGTRVYGAKCDVWGLGCILGEMVYGQAVFQGDFRDESQSEIRQLQVIIAILGPPPSAIWPSYSTLPLALKSVTSPQPPIGLRRMMQQRPFFDPDMFDLLQSLLDWNPARRPSTKEILSHRFFDDIKL